ncbi:hypothetical protein CVT24_012250 [Panaeolus cyanescens]|uniref:Wax synthase domain-containing protein n=1 Tax=Panaeolus cyanescens TaxID=181874 RepID=A0A409W5L4_9AGAR|nr:hypothetical protein CVT24_012250 [Panaeolus cyanescens]
MYESVFSLKTILLFGLTEIFGILCFATRTPFTRWLSFTALLGIIYFQLYHTKIVMSNSVGPYGVGARLVGILCVVFEPMFVRDALKRSRWIGDKKASETELKKANGNGKATYDASKGEALDIDSASFSQRFMWSLSLYANPRAIGWAHENPAILPPRPSSWTSRRGFIRWQIIHVLIVTLIHDVDLTLMRRNPYFLGLPIPADASILLKALWLLHRGVGEGIIAASGTILNLSNQAIVWVALGTSDIASWRPVLGSMTEAYTVRNLWGKAWHQIFRRPFTMIGNTIADAIRLPKRGKLRLYFVLFTAFALSAAIHSCGDFVILGSWRETKSWTFFLPQVGAIWFEDVVIKLGRRAGIRKNFFTVMLGYVWVLAWLAMITGPMTESHVKAKFYEGRMEFSIVDGLLTGQWSQIQTHTHSQSTDVLVTRVFHTSPAIPTRPGRAMYESVVNLTTIVLYFLTEALGVLCISVRPYSMRWVVFLALLGLIYFQLYHTKMEAINFSTKHGLGCRFASVVCLVSECMFKRDVLREFRWIGDKKEQASDMTKTNGKATNGVHTEKHTSEAEEKEKETDITTASFLKRFHHGLSIYSNPRGIGWAHQQSGLPPRPASWRTRKGYILSKIPYILTCWFLYDLNLTLTRRNPYFLNIPVPSDASIFLKALWLAHRGIGEGLCVAMGMSLNLDCVSILFVSLGLADVASYRPLFGSISDGYTVQNLWGKAWHQTFRRPFLVIANGMADVLHLPKKTKLQAYFVFVGVFAVSCLLHSVGDFALVGSWRETKTWTFFLPQAGAIFFESIIISLAKKAGIRKNVVTVAIGYAWVISWLAFITGPITESHAKHGYYSDRFEFSFVDGLWTGQWNHYPHTDVFKWY